MDTLPLSGVKIIDFSRIIQGPYATTLLGDMGADVINIENPVTSLRTLQRDSAYYRNKRSICINLKEEEGKNIIYELVKTADAVIENFRPGVADRLGVGYEKLLSINPRIVYLSASGFGSAGPYQRRGAWDHVTQGASGLMNLTGEPPPRPPNRHGIGIFIDGTTAHYNAIAILTGLRMRKKTGKGIHLDTSLFQTAVSLLSYYAGRYLNTGFETQRKGPYHNTYFSGVFKTKDEYKPEYIVVTAPNDATFRTLCKAVDKTDFADDILSRYPNVTMAWQNSMDEFVKTFVPIFKTKPGWKWLELLIEAGIPCGPVYQLDEVFRDPQVQHRKMVVETEKPSFGKLKLMANPIRGSEKMTELRLPPPQVGEHTDEILRKLGKNEEEIGKLKADGVVKSLDMIEAEQKEKT